MNVLTEDEVKALFTLAGIKVLNSQKLPNGYCNDHCCWNLWWWFLKTEVGWVKIGWRKRVINIDWSDTPIRTIITDDETTKWDEGVHAWSVDDAIKYLRALGVEVKKIVKESAAN